MGVVVNLDAMSEPLPTGSGAQDGLDRRSRGRQRRRDRVYVAAIELFIERGFDNTTMDDIAERADVARASVFNYFPRKSNLLDEWGARRRARALQAVYSSNVEVLSLRQALERYMVELARINSQSRVEAVSLIHSAVHTLNMLGHPALAEEFGRFLEQAQADGQLPESADPWLGGLLLATGYFAVLTAWVDVEPAPFDLQRELLCALDVLLDGLYNPRPAGQDDAAPSRTKRAAAAKQKRSSRNGAPRRYR